MPCGKKIPMKRGLGAAAVCASAELAGIIASRSGSASVQPALFRNVRRRMCFFAMNIWLSGSLAAGPFRGDGVTRHRPFLNLHVHLERRAVDDAEDERGETIVASFRVSRDRSHERHVLILDAASERVRQQLLGHDLDELIGIFEQPLAQGGGAVDCRAVENFRRRSEEHTSELQSPYDLVCRLLLEKKKKKEKEVQ